MTTFNHLNHLLTRADAWEKSTKAPIRHFVMPASAAALAVSVLTSDLHHTVGHSNRKKVKIRDTLTIAGTTAGLMAGIALAKSRLGAETAYRLAKLLGREIDLNHMPLSKGAKAYVKRKPWGKDLSDHHHHHHHGDELAVKDQLGKRLSQLFKTQAHDHGIAGILMLESMAAGSILGGIGGGTLADHFNKEDLKKTLPAKLYESIFQFMGNITLCTVAILAGSWLGKGAARQTLKTATIQNMTEKRLANYLAKIHNAGKSDLRRVPTGFTEAFESAWIKLKYTRQDKEAKNQFQKDILHWIGHYYPKQTTQYQEFKTLLAKHLEQPTFNHANLRSESYQYLSNELKKELQQFKNKPTVSQIENKALRGDIQMIARHRFEETWQQIGVIIGFGAGIIGGAIASNKLNDLLAKTFHFEKPVNQATLFHAQGHNSGALKNTVGERGIHWWDMVLHLDDWPSALYMAGIEMLEPIIRILYGMSGYLSGIAGTSYSHGAKPEHSSSVPPAVKPSIKYVIPYSEAVPPTPRPKQYFQSPPEPTYLQSS